MIESPLLSVPDDEVMFDVVRAGSRPFASARAAA
jgi:hypothetical protein